MDNFMPQWKYNNAEYYKLFLLGMDLSFKISITSITSSAITAPLTIWLSNMQVTTPIKFTPLSFARAYWQVLPSLTISNHKRGAVTVTSKHVGESYSAEMDDQNTPELAIKYSKNYNPYLVALFFSQLDTAIAAVYYNRAKLNSQHEKKIYLNKHNVKQLFFMGYPLKSTANFISYISLLTLSDIFAKNFSINNHETAANFIGGGLTGIISSVLSHPFNILNDRLVLNTKITADGKLTRISSLSFFKQKVINRVNDNFYEAMQEFWLATKNELPPRLLATMAVFAVIQGLNYIMGPKPLTRLLKLT